MQILVAKRGKIWSLLDPSKKKAASRPRANTIINYRFRTIVLSAEKWHPEAEILGRYRDEKWCILDIVLAGGLVGS